MSGTTLYQKRSLQNTIVTENINNTDTVTTESLICNDMSVTGTIDSPESTITVLITEVITHPDLGGLIDVTSDLDMNTNNILNTANVELDSISKNGLGDISVTSNVNFGNKDLSNIKDLYVKGVIATVGANCVEFLDCIDMLDHPIDRVTDIELNSINKNGVGDISITSNLDMNTNDILNTYKVECDWVVSNTGNLQFNGDSTVFKNLINDTNYLRIGTQLISYSALNMSNNDIFDVKTLTLSDTLNASFVNCTSELFCNTISHPLNAEISITDDINMEANDILNVNDIDSNTIVIHDGLKITDVGDVTGITSNCGLHIKSNAASCAYFQANADGIDASGAAHIWNTLRNPTTHPGKSFGSFIGHSSSSGNFYMAIGNEDDNTSGVFDIYSSRLTIDELGSTTPVFNGASNLLCTFDNTQTSLQRDLNLNNNDIINVGKLDFQTVPINDDAETRLLVLDTATNAVEYRNVSSLPYVPSLPYTDQTFTFDIEFNNLVEGVETRGTSILNLGVIPPYVASEVDRTTLIGDTTLVSNVLYNVQVHFGKSSAFGMNENNAFKVQLGSGNFNNSCSYIANCDISPYTDISNYFNEMNPKSLTFTTDLTNSFQFRVTPLTVGSTSLAANAFVYRMFVRFTRVG